MVSRKNFLISCGKKAFNVNQHIKEGLMLVEVNIGPKRPDVLRPTPDTYYTANTSTYSSVVLGYVSVSYTNSFFESSGRFK